MSDLPKAYDHSVVEKKWYQFWERIEAFQASPSSNKPPFCIVLPPPNVTGVLHMGHALVDTMQDIIIRFKRMQGYEALWVPGTDHAGISTQTVVERHLIASEGKRRTDYSREDFLARVHTWKEQHQQRIIDQLKKVGCSLDWSKLRFTMDEEANLAVKTLFKKMFEDGLIYQGDYLVNWDPITQTALADDEVEYEEALGSLWYFRYPLKEGEGYITIATTRPETMLGDVAVAVSPDDERYQHLIGKTICLPIVNRDIPVIADAYVEKEFGSGAVKITPAHDFNDYEIGIRHDLDMINIMTPDGKINDHGGEFAGLTMLQAREAIVKRMRELDLCEKIIPHKNRVGYSYRSKAVIEPYLSKQWFVKITDYKEQLIQVIKNNQIKMIPKYWEKTYFHWIENLKDWCISRQLWWGHRIPIWHHKEDPSKKICYIGEGVPPEVEKEPDLWKQDENVLDTWFSSALWPFSALGWPNNKEMIKKFYPNQVLITGHDILFFWVARMIFMGLYQMKEIPFYETFIHGLIYGKSYWKKTIDGSIEYVSKEERIRFELGEKIPDDVESKWEKMSKSKGNVIDPIEIIDSYGADAMRMALTSSVTDARQIDLDRRKFEEYKNFSNKFWNGSRFIFLNIEDLDPAALFTPIDESLLLLEDEWILLSYNTCLEKVTHAFETYDFDLSAVESYRFFWDEFCAYYVELCKPYLFRKAGSDAIRTNKQKILVHLLLGIIRMMHPIIPFITEEIFQLLKERFEPKTDSLPVDQYAKESYDSLLSKACIVAPFPKEKQHAFVGVKERFAYIDAIIHQIRTIRAEMGLAPTATIDLYIISKNRPNLFIENKQMIQSLIKINNIYIEEEEKQFPFASSAKVEDLELIIPLPAEYLEKEKKRVEKEIEKISKQVQQGEIRLANPDFIEKAPSHLVEQVKSKLDSDISSLEKLKKIFVEFE